MALIINNLLVNPNNQQTVPDNRQSGPVSVVPSQVKIAGVSAGQIVNLTQQRIDAEAAAKRPLIYDPLEYTRISTPTPAPQPVQHQEVLVKKKVTGQSQYMQDMLTVERL